MGSNVIDNFFAKSIAKSMIYLWDKSSPRKKPTERAILGETSHTVPSIFINKLQLTN